MKNWVEKNEKFIKLALIIAVILSVVLAGIEEIKAVLETDIQTYYVHEAYGNYAPVQEVYEKEFLCVGSQMEMIQIEANILDETTGNIFYQIVGADGQLVEERTCDISALITEARDGLYLSASDIGLVQGERYVLRADFTDVENLEVYFGSGTLSLRQYFHFPYQTQYIVGVLGFMFLSFVWLYWVCKKGFSTKLFFVTSLVIGLILAVGMAPMCKDDEYRHFIRSYTAGVDYAYINYEPMTGDENGLMGFGGDGDYIATVPYVINELRLMDFEENYNGYGYVQEVNQKLCVEKLIATLKAEPTETTYQVGATATASRSGWFYWPQIMGVKIGAALGFGDIALYYAARIGQVFVCVLMETLAILLAPRIKEMIWLIGFIPNIWFLKASCNCDGLLISEIILLTAVVVWLKEEKIDLISKKGVMGLLGYALLSFNIIILKAPFIFVCMGLLPYLTKDNFKTLLAIMNKNRKVTAIIGAVAVVGMAVVFILMDKTFILNIIYSFLPKAHIIYMIQNPLYIAKLFAMKWFEMVAQLYVSMKGSNFIPYAIMVVLLLMCMKERQPIWKRLYFAVLFAGLIMVIVLAGYSLTPPDHGYIWGITYRYLLPFVIVGALCLPFGNEKTERIAQKLVPLAVFVMTATSMIDYVVWWSI